jgi:biopolymer transport protein ExbB/TolQ
MVLTNSAILLFALLFSLTVSWADTGSEVSHAEMVKRINERYDDFFIHRQAQEEREQKTQGSRDERRKREKAHAEEMEKARKDYVRSRKARPSDEALRLRHEAAEKERAANLEMLRRRYVQRRDVAEQYLKKGRKIPELKEFDLEGY